MKKIFLIFTIIFAFIFSACEDPIVGKLTPQHPNYYRFFTLLQTISGHSSIVYSVAWSPDGSKIISGSTDNTIKIWDANTGECLQKLGGHYGYSVSSVAYSPDGTKIISGSTDKTIKIWDANTGECLKTLEGHEYGVSSVAFSHDGTKIISGSSDKTIKIWGVE